MCFAADGRPRPASFYGRLGVAVGFSMWAAHIAIKASRNYLEALAVATRNHDDDLFAHQLCSDPTIKAGLGRYDLCDRARINVQLSPGWQATWKFGDQILHCGDDVSCLEWAASGVRSLTSSLNGLVLAVAALLALPVAAYLICHLTTTTPADAQRVGGPPLPVFQRLTNAAGGARTKKKTR